MLDPAAQKWRKDMKNNIKLSHNTKLELRSSGLAFGKTKRPGLAFPFSQFLHHCDAGKIKTSIRFRRLRYVQAGLSRRERSLRVSISLELADLTHTR